MNIHPQYITDTNGNKSMVILPTEEFDSIMEQLDDMADIELYDEAKKNDTGERITLSDYIELRKSKNA